MRKFKVWYKASLTKDIHTDTINADGFHIVDGILVFFDRMGCTTRNIAAYKEYLRVMEEIG